MRARMTANITLRASLHKVSLPAYSHCSTSSWSRGNLSHGVQVMFVFIALLCCVALLNLAIQLRFHRCVKNQQCCCCCCCYWWWWSWWQLLGAAVACIAHRY